MESLRSMSVSGTHDGIVCTLKRLRWPHPSSSCPLQHTKVGALLDLIHLCMQLPSVDISALRRLQHPGVSLQFKRHLHIFTVASRGPSGGCLTPTHFAWPQQSFGVLVQASNLRSQPHGHPILFWSEIHADTGCQFAVFYTLGISFIKFLNVACLRVTVSVYSVFPHSVWALFLEYLLYAVLGFKHLRQSKEYVNQVPTFNKAYLVMKKGKCANNTDSSVTSSSNSATQKEWEKRKTRCQRMKTVAPARTL